MGLRQKLVAVFRWKESAKHKQRRTRKCKEEVENNTDTKHRHTHTSTPAGTPPYRLLDDVFPTTDVSVASACVRERFRIYRSELMKITAITANFARCQPSKDEIPGNLCPHGTFSDESIHKEVALKPADAIISCVILRLLQR